MHPLTWGISSVHILEYTTRYPVSTRVYTMLVYICAPVEMVTPGSNHVDTRGACYFAEYTSWCFQDTLQRGE